jgi:S1-C subfamily serine protease
VVSLTAVAVVIIVNAVDQHDDAATCPTADGRTRELRRCMQPVLAFVETPFATGSGVLVDGGYVVTNAHVVDPFAEVTLTLGGRTFDDVEVIGVDAFADIAVLGPIDTDTNGVMLQPIEGFDEDDEPDVFLVGYPGGVEGDDPAVAISDGVVSRMRDDEVTGLRYVQTDAAIAGGQSGGALIDGVGRLLGISGLGFAEEFALALVVDDVIASIDRVRAGDGDQRRVIPIAGDDTLITSAELSLDEFATRGVMLFPADDGGPITLTIGPDTDVALGVDVSTSTGDVIGSNDAFLDRLIEEGSFTEDEVADMPRLEETRPGVFEFEAPDDAVVYVDISSPVGDAVTTVVSVSADVPFFADVDTQIGEDVLLGEPVRGVLDGFASEAVHLMRVDEPGEYVITVSAGASDAYVTVLAPGETYDISSEPSADDGGGGLYGLDSEYRFDVDDDQVGSWTVVVGAWDGVITGYTLVAERG